MDYKLINLLKTGKKLTRKTWINKQYIFMENETLYIYWCADKERSFIKEANQDNFPYEELFEDDWVVFSED